MTRIMSVTQAKAQFSAVIAWAAQDKDEIIIQNRGAATAVIIPYDEYEAYKKSRELARRQEAVARLHQIAKQVQQQNQDLTPEAADALADEITRDSIDNLSAKDEFHFQE